jgi:hyperosmotically inducible protein
VSALVMVIAISSVAAHAVQLGAIKDGWLVMKVHSEMVDEDVLDGSDIDVDVKDGVVTLQGTVPSEAARSRALAVAKANDGVKRVVDQLRIAPGHDRAAATTERAGERAADKTGNAAGRAGRAIDDGWIKSKIYAQYLADWNTVLDDSDIDVDVNDNLVTLNGTVKSAEAKAKAVATAKATDGVKGVTDNLRVVPAD